MAGGARVSCVVGDAFMSMAAEAGVPWVAVWTGGPCRSPRRRDPEDIADNAASRCNELLTSHPGLGSFRVRDLPFGDPATGGDMFRVMSLLLHRVAKRLPRSATATSLNFFPGLFPPDVSATFANAIPNSLPMGPYHLIPGANASATVDDPLGCLPWLSRRPAGSVAYASFGTAVALQPDELHELALGLEDSGAPFLWSLLEDSWPLLPPGFMDRIVAEHSGLLVPWAPQDAVLRHEAVGAFVTHAGWGAVVEAMAGGVSMLCRPFFGDQMMNAQTVEHMWGFGIAFENDAPMTRGGVVAAVASLLTGEEGARMRARARDLQAMVFRAFEPDGGSTVNFRKFVDTVCAPA